MLKPLQRKPVKKLLCKKCKVKPRVSLAFCKECLKKHNAQTLALKHKYRSEDKCVMCGTPSKTRRCKTCQTKDTICKRDSNFRKSNKAKSGKFGGIEQISEVI